MAKQKGPPTKTPAPSVQWLLQIEGGRVLGPLTTAEIIFRISEGTLTGQEKIRKSPDGNWVVISREPLFYDKLLEALESHVKKNQEFDDDKTVAAKPIDVQAPPPKLAPFTQSSAATVAPVTPPEMPESDAHKTIQNEPHKPLLQPRTNIEHNEKKFETKKILMGVFLILIMAAGLLFYESQNRGDKVELKRPAVKLKTTLSVAKQDKKMKEVLSEINRDTVEDYIKAQDDLVELIEGAPEFLQARGLLCVVQRELWPYARQDSNDYNIIQDVRKSTRMRDGTGINGMLCETTYLMILGKYTEAIGMIEHAASKLSPDPILDSLRAEILAARGSYKDAAIWANESAKLLPVWVKPHYQKGVYLNQSAKPQEALESLEQALRLNPSHRAAMIEYGSVLYSKFQKKEAAALILHKALSSNARIPKNLEAQAHYITAKILAENNKIKEALTHAQRAYQLDSGNLDIRDFVIQLGGTPTLSSAVIKNNEIVFLGDQYYRAGDYLSAQAEYKAAFEADPTNAMAAAKAGKSLWHLHQVSAAIEWLKKSAKADPNLSVPYYLLADYYSQRYEFQEATEALNAGARRISNNAEIVRGYGLVEFRRNNFKDAIAFLERALKIYDSDQETLVLLAKAYIAEPAEANYKKAMERILRAIELDDTNVEAQVVYAKILIETEGVERGISYLKDLMNKYTYTLEFRMGLAEVYKEVERYREAQELYAQVLLSQPKNKEAKMGLAQSYQAQANLREALRLYLDASIDDTSDPEPLIRAGLVYLEAGRPEDAYKQFKRGISVNPNYPKAHYYIAKAAFAVKNYSEVIKETQEEKMRNPNLADAYILAGEAYTVLRDYDKCATEYQQAIKIRPQGAENYVKQAVCVMSAGNLDVAESMLSIAAAQESGYAEIYKVQGLIYEKKRSYQEAAQAYEKYLMISPNATDKKEIENKINNLGGN